MIYCKGKGRKYGGEYKRGKKQEDEEICVGTCKVCGGEEEVPSLI